MSNETVSDDVIILDRMYCFLFGFHYLFVGRVGI